MSTLSLEVSRCPSLYQVRTGGGTALVSQYRDMGLFRITSFTSPLLSVLESPKPRKLGGTETKTGFYCYRQGQSLKIVVKDLQIKALKQAENEIQAILYIYILGVGID